MTLIADIPKISAPSPLQKISSHTRHVGKLRGWAFEQSFGNNWIVGYYLWVFCHIAQFLPKVLPSIGV
jgi:hypothetical protein